MKHFCPFVDCKASFPRPSKLELHVRKIHLKEQLFKCTHDGCGKDYTQASHLKRHIEISHNGNAATFHGKCSFVGCEAVFQTKCGLVRHEKLHSIEKAFSCLHCSKSFRLKRVLEKHMVTHTGKPRFPCSKCHLTFNDHHYHRKHLTQTHAVHFCDHRSCKNLQFDDFKALRKHKSSVHALKFSCADCPKQFLRRFHLVEHITSEHEGISLACSYEGCDRKFAYKRNLETHLRLHLNKRFTCATCGNELSTKQKLQEHIAKIHQGTAKPRSYLKRSKSKVGEVLGLYHDHDKLMNKEADVLLENSVQGDSSAT